MRKITSTSVAKVLFEITVKSATGLGGVTNSLSVAWKKSNSEGTTREVLQTNGTATWTEQFSFESNIYKEKNNSFEKKLLAFTLKEKQKKKQHTLGKAILNLSDYINLSEKTNKHCVNLTISDTRNIMLKVDVNVIIQKLKTGDKKKVVVNSKGEWEEQSDNSASDWEASASGTDGSSEDSSKKKKRSSLKRLSAKFDSLSFSDSEKKDKSSSYSDSEKKDKKSGDTLTRKLSRSFSKSSKESSPSIDSSLFAGYSHTGSSDAESSSSEGQTSDSKLKSSGDSHKNTLTRKLSNSLKTKTKSRADGLTSSDGGAPAVSDEGTPRSPTRDSAPRSSSANKTWELALNTYIQDLKGDMKPLSEILKGKSILLHLLKPFDQSASTKGAKDLMQLYPILQEMDIQIVLVGSGTWEQSTKWASQNQEITTRCELYQDPSAVLYANLGCPKVTTLQLKKQEHHLGGIWVSRDCSLKRSWVEKKGDNFPTPEEILKWCGASLKQLKQFQDQGPIELKPLPTTNLKASDQDMPSPNKGLPSLPPPSDLPPPLPTADLATPANHRYSQPPPMDLPPTLESTNTAAGSQTIVSPRGLNASARGARSVQPTRVASHGIQTKHNPSESSHSGAEEKSKWKQMMAEKEAARAALVQAEKQKDAPKTEDERIAEALSMLGRSSEDAMKARRTDKDDAEEAEALAWMEAEQQKAKAEQAIRQQQDRERAERAAAERAASERDAQQKAHYEAEQQRIREQQLREVEIQRARDLQNKLDAEERDRRQLQLKQIEEEAARERLKEQKMAEDKERADREAARFKAEQERLQFEKLKADHEKHKQEQERRQQEQQRLAYEQHEREKAQQKRELELSLQKEKEAFEREQLRLKQQEAVRSSPQQVNRNLAHSGGGGGQEAARSSPQQPNRSQSPQLIPPHGGPTGGGGGAPGTNQQQGKPPPGPTQQVRPPQMQRTQSESDDSGNDAGEGTSEEESSSDDSEEERKQNAQTAKLVSILDANKSRATLTPRATPQASPGTMTREQARKSRRELAAKRAQSEGSGSEEDESSSEPAGGIKPGADPEGCKCTIL